MAIIDMFTNLMPRGSAPVVPVVRLFGPIGMGGRMRQGFDFTTMVGPLERAFRLRKPAAIALIINSPGGSPAQSSLIAKRIIALKTEKKIPVIAFVEDAAASGGYYIASAADEIFVDESSIVGSIGVISAGFGLHEAIAKIGVERRVYTAGTAKMMLDPFQPERADDVARLKHVQERVHQTFRDVVKAGRGDRIDLDDPDLFTGAIWVGQDAVDKGLADGVGDMRSVLRARFGEKVRFRIIATESGGFLRRTLGLSAPDLAGDALAALEARLMWSRLGL